MYYSKQAMTPDFRDHDIILLTCQRFDKQYSSITWALAKEFAKNNRVFHIDHPYTWRDWWNYRGTPNAVIRKDAFFSAKEIYHQPIKELEQLYIVFTKLALPINWLNRGKLFDFFSRVNDKMVFDIIKRTIKDFNIEKFVFINSWDPFYGRFYLSDIQPDINIYQSFDDISQEAYIARHGIYLEEEVASKADLVLATSVQLKRSMQQYADHVYLLQNAVDSNLFKKAITDDLPRPKELQAVEGKVICYTGNISRSRVDFEILKEIALRHSDKTLIMVGPTDSDKHIEYGLDKMPNVIFTGPKDISELPAYLKYADVAIIPFQCNQLTQSIYPLKINEYLATGCSVVSTPFSEDIRSFEDVIYLANGAEQFAEMVGKAIDHDSEEERKRRVEEAEKNTWTARVEQFWNILEEYNNNVN